MFHKTPYYIARAWWLTFELSILLIVSGVAVILFPIVFFILFVQIIALLIITWGIAQIIHGIQLIRRGHNRIVSVSFLATGGSLVLLSCILLISPWTATMYILILICWLMILWSIVAVGLRRHNWSSRITWLLIGAFSVCICPIISWHFVPGATRLPVEIFGGYMCINGILLLIYAFDLRRNIQNRIQAATNSKSRNQSNIIDL